MKRREILRSLGATGISTVALTGIASAKQAKETPTTDVLERGDSYKGNSRSEYIQEALTSYDNSNLEEQVKFRGYELNRGDILTFVGNSHDEETVYVYITLQKQEAEQVLGSNDFSGIRRDGSKRESTTSRSHERKMEGSSNGSINIGHFIWSNDKTENHVLRNGEAKQIVPARYQDVIPTSSSSATELISNSKHIIDVIGEANSAETQSSGSGTEAVHVSIDLHSETTSKSKSQVSQGNPRLSTQDTGCPSSFTSALVALIGCGGGCVVCVGLLAEPATTIVTCAACGGCGVVAICCVGALAPDSMCSEFGMLRYTAPDADQKLAAQFMYDGCRGKECVPSIGA